MKLSVLIPNYNGKTLLESMLPSLYKALKHLTETEVIIYDNNSTDGSKLFIRDMYPDIRLIESMENDGFTRAVNAAAISAKGEFILILNNDCFVNDKTIPDMIHFLKKHPEYCMTQPVVLSKNGKVENIGFLVDTYIGKARAVTDLKDSHIAEEYMKFPSKSGLLYGLSATCLLAKKKEFLDICMFDESFHSYLEDVDLAFRLALAGKKYFPTLEAECIHAHMATSSKMGSYKQQKDVTNWIRIIFKNYPLSMILANFLPLTIERMRNLNGLFKKLAF